MLHSRFDLDRLVRAGHHTNEDLASATIFFAQKIVHAILDKVAQLACGQALGTKLVLAFLATIASQTALASESEDAKMIVKTSFINNRLYNHLPFWPDWIEV